MSKKKKNKAAENITFINMPIASTNEDKIGISQCATELQTVIKKGAQSIAVTSGFGGGKSSLIRCLESMYSGFTTKFCYVNLWSQIDSDKSEDLHKSFIYQLAAQISTKKGNYVSRRLSQNYGMLGITLPSKWSAFWSFIMFLFVAAGFACTTFYEEISKYINVAFFNTHHNKLGVACFVVVAFLALIFLYKTDIIFSSAKSETSRTIDEHELMDIYRTHICKFHLKHYIVVIEDLDRSNHKRVNQFIKELRRYYIPCKHKRSKCWIVNWFNDIVLGKINRITFIVNIKEENEIAEETDEDLYSKAFDYVLNLKQINIDNFGVILNKLLEENRHRFKANNIPAFDGNDSYIPEFEWIIRGRKIGIREIKRRLNATISTYINLCSKFEREYISLEKCIASAYIITAFEKEYTQIQKLGFDSIIDLYVTNPKMTVEDIVEEYAKKDADIKISAEFAEDIKTLIDNGMIASDYRQYFFNFPSNSHLRSDKQNKLSNILLYDQDVVADEKFDELVHNVIDTDKTVIIDSFNRLKRLGKPFPNCIFFNRTLFDLALSYDDKMMYSTLSEKLLYDVESISSTAKTLVEVINRNLLDKQEMIDKICEIVTLKAPARSIITFRRRLIESFYSGIMKFKKLFFGDCPLITKAEVESLLNSKDLLNLVNLESSELDMPLVQTIHTTLLSGLDLTEETILDDVAAFYVELYAVLGTTENEMLTAYMFEVINKSKVIHEKIEKVIIENNNWDDIQERYVGAINLADHYGKISPNTLRYIDELQISSDLPESICIKLKDDGFWKAFIINAFNTDIALIDFASEETLSALQQIDFTNQSDKTVSVEMLLTIRKHILTTTSITIAKRYRHLFMLPYTIITEPELQLINNKFDALTFIDVSQIDDSTCSYIAKYICECQFDQNGTYEILCFAMSIESPESQKAFFLALDFNKLQYYRISAQRKKSVIDALSSAFDFEDVEEQLVFMSHTKCTNGVFEKQIKKAITEKKFSKLEDKYAEYIRNAKTVTNEMINNLCALSRIYAMPSAVLEKLYAAKRYTYYVIAKAQQEGYFALEEDKKDILMPTYRTIFLSGEQSYPNTKAKMVKNQAFVSLMRDQEEYVDAQPHSRLLFAYAPQTVRCLDDLFDNYSDKFIEEYLSKSVGFYDREAAVRFIELLRSNKTIAASNEVYNNNYLKLVDSTLKSNYTKCHNNAKNQEGHKK